MIDFCIILYNSTTQVFQLIGRKNLTVTIPITSITKSYFFIENYLIDKKLAIAITYCG